MTRRRIAAATALICAAGFVAAFYVVFGLPWSGSDIAAGVTPSLVRRIQLGMTTNEVESLLGPPVEVRAEQSGMAWAYARPVPRVRSWPTIELSFVDSRVTRVVVEGEVFWGVDEEVTYLLSRDLSFERPPFADGVF